MIAVRRAAAEDVARLRAIDPLAATDRDRHDLIERSIAAGECQVADDDGVVAGFAVLTRGFFHRPFIELVVVAEESRRRGIGTALVAHCARLAAPDAVWTSTNESNRPMRRLLSASGFIESGRIEDLDPGDPELIFLRRTSI
jgi:ribosomal protein S18 acetylase RimI-like enzyme